MQITTHDFGQLEGQEIKQFVLTNENGMKVKITNYGATITSIKVPDGTKEADLVCGFDSFDSYFEDSYKNNAPYFGCTVGRYASRIKDGKFSVDGVDYSVAVNNGSNHLHGGITGFDKKIWSANKIANGVEMSLTSPDMEEGYPGNVDIKITFTLNDKNELSISYNASTDKPTPLSLTNHSYFNLSGFKDTIENHYAKVQATTHLAADETNVPVGLIENLSGTAADLSQGKLFKDAFSGLETGFEHYFLFDKGIGSLAKVAEFKDTDSGRTLEIETTEPGMLFYSGYFTSDELKRESGEQYGRYRGFCCETHRFPNGPNIENSPNSLTQPGEKYTSQTVYRFGF